MIDFSKKANRSEGFETRFIRLDKVFQQSERNETATTGITRKRTQYRIVIVPLDPHKQFLSVHPPADDPEAESYQGGLRHRFEKGSADQEDVVAQMDF